MRSIEILKTLSEDETFGREMDKVGESVKRKFEQYEELSLPSRTRGGETARAIQEGRRRCLKGEYKVSYETRRLIQVTKKESYKDGKEQYKLASTMLMHE